MGYLKMESTITKEMKIWLAASAIGLIAALTITMHTQAFSESVQNEIAENVIRFHVLAHSNSANDQALKDVVRDGVLEEFKQRINSGSSIEESRDYLTQHLDEIREYAATLVEKQGYDYSVQAVIGRAFFPTRVYGDIAFPAGDYEALRIIIGEGRGDNWWCVMFPPLCYVDATQHNPDDDDIITLQHLLTDDTYALMNHSQHDMTVTVRFKIVEWWQEWQQNEPTSIFVRR